MESKDKDFKKGFKFEHVWEILKDCEKLAKEETTPSSQRRRLHAASSQSDSPTPEGYISSNSATHGISSFSLDINEETGDDEHGEGTSSQRPMGVKKAKLKNKVDDESTKYFNTIEEKNDRLGEMLKKGSGERQQIFQVEMVKAQNSSKKLQMAELREENKYIFADLNKITDPTIRNFVRSEQKRIMEKRNQQEHQGSQPSSGSFGQYFDGLGGPDNDLPEY